MPQCVYTAILKIPQNKAERAHTHTHARFNQLHIISQSTVVGLLSGGGGSCRRTGRTRTPPRPCCSTERPTELLKSRGHSVLVEAKWNQHCFTYRVTLIPCLIEICNKSLCAVTKREREGVREDVDQRDGNRLEDEGRGVGHLVKRMKNLNMICINFVILETVHTVQILENIWGQKRKDWKKFAL